MAMMTFTSESFVMNKNIDKIKKDMKSKMGIIAAEFYRTLKLYKSVFGYPVIDSVIDMKINEQDYIKISVSINEENLGDSVCEITFDNMTLKSNVVFNNKAEQQIKKDMKEQIVSLSKDIENNMSDKELSDKYDIRTDEVEKIKTNLDIIGSVTDDKKKFEKEETKRKTTLRPMGGKRKYGSAIKNHNEIVLAFANGNGSVDDNKKIRAQVMEKFSISYSTINKFINTYGEEIDKKRKELSEAKEKANKVAIVDALKPKATVAPVIKPNRVIEKPVDTKVVETVDSYTEAKIIEKLIQGSSITDIAEEFKVKNNVIMGIATFNKSFIDSRKAINNIKEEDLSYKDAPSKAQFTKLIDAYSK